MAAVTLILLGSLLLVTSLVSADMKQLKDEIMSHLKIIEGNVYEIYAMKIGYFMIRYGRCKANCPCEGDISEGSKTRILSLTTDYSFEKKKAAVASAYENLSLSEEGEDGLLLWHLMQRFVEIYVFEYTGPPAQGYTFRKPGCTVVSEECTLHLPSRPEELSLTELQCKKVDNYLQQIALRIFQAPDDPTLFAMDLLTLKYYAFGDLFDNAQITNPKERSVRMGRMIEGYFKNGWKTRMETVFVQVLKLRIERENLFKEEIQMETRSDKKKDLEDRQLLYSTATTMMMHGWIKMTKLPEDTRLLQLAGPNDEPFEIKVPAVDLSPWEN